MWTVYCHINKINNKKYIGITKKTTNDRWRNGKGYHNYFGNAIKKYGWDNFEHLILFEDLTENEAKLKEKELILEYNSFYPNGYNLTLGGDGNCGWSPSKGTREKIGKSNIGKHHRKLSDETKEKIRQARLGKPTMTGKHWSVEQTKKMSEIMKGNKYSVGHIVSEKSRKQASDNMPHRREVLQYTLDGQFITEYHSLKEAGKAVNTTPSNIGYCCRGVLKTCKGYKWKFKN